MECCNYTIYTIHKYDTWFLKKFPELDMRLTDDYKPNYHNGWISPNGEYFRIEYKNRHEFFTLKEYNVRQREMVRMGWIKIQQLMDNHITALYTKTPTEEQYLALKLINRNIKEHYIPNF